MKNLQMIWNSIIDFIGITFLFLLTMAFIAISIAIPVGWGMNIIALIKATSFTVMVLVQLIGIFIFPIGAITGWYWFLFL